MKIYSKIEKKKKNLINIKNYINIYFLESLSQFQVQNKIYTNKLNEVNFIKNIYSNVLKSRFGLKSFFFNGYPSTKNGRKIFVYIAEINRISDISHRQLDKKILDTIEKNDWIIAIGKHAIQFAQENKLNILTTFESIDEKYVNDLKALIYDKYTLGGVYQIEFFFQSNKLKNNSVVILPIKNFHLDKSFEDEEIDPKIEIYPNLTDFVDDLSWIYLQSSISALLIEANFYLIKQRIAKLKDLLNDIDKKIENIKYESSKFRKDILNENVLTTTQ
ncbi:unknown; predicted coding region [Mycoplasmopsis pulmonis]|uniref:ATP synthase gamma chain n=1 Tax=Mycoplasmopsis pulmonis (strain UAB CTIP) TaxID=272635 RepID=Q98QC0_MYCPU|nr:hypothetical protein [Mycoplasmopsis pulmonis]CAC13619.1 unknown; predicted coding region [Mycoplasmopsis pulmonis]